MSAPKYSPWPEESGTYELDPEGQWRPVGGPKTFVYVYPSGATATVTVGPGGMSLSEGAPGPGGYLLTGVAGAAPVTLVPCNTCGKHGPAGKPCRACLVTECEEMLERVAFPTEDHWTCNCGRTITGPANPGEDVFLTCENCGQEWQGAGLGAIRKVQL